MSGLDHQQQIKQIEKYTDEEYEYNNNNAEDIYDQDIDYNEYIYQEGLDGLLKANERNPDFHQDDDKENYEDAEG